MAPTEPKAIVLQRFLDFVQEYVPLQEARLATLGGDGWEATLWKSAGVPAENAWLIECARTPSCRLIDGFSYRYSPTLARFPYAFCEAHGETAGIDGFHLDLCGTLATTMQAFLPVVPFVTWRGRGRCLAITVADARRNRTLEQFQDVQREGDQTLGAEASRMFLRTLAREHAALGNGKAEKRRQTADPEKGARREFGFFLNVLELLAGDGWRITALPDRIERVVYVSRYSGHPFRMRTTFFHFGELTANSRGNLARQLLARWLARPLECIPTPNVSNERNPHERL